MDISIVADGIINENVHNTKEILKERLELFKDGGINCIDYTVGHKPITLSDEWINMMAESLEETGVRVTQTHGPVVATLYCKDGDCAFQMKPEDKKRLEIAFKSANKYNCKSMVIHPFSQWPEWDNKYMALGRQTNIDFFNNVLDMAYKYDVDICLENLVTNDELFGYCANPVELKELHDILNDPKIKYCVDTGHANCSGYGVHDVINILGGDIKVLHIQDNFGTNDGHCMPPFGNIDWNLFAKALADVGYNGTINFEINGGRMQTLDDIAKVAYLKFVKSMGEYIIRMINEYKR